MLAERGKHVPSCGFGMSIRHQSFVIAAASLAAWLAIAGRSIADDGVQYALLVGVQTYDHDLRNLRFTERDVVGLGEVLRDSGYRRRNVVIMTQSAGAMRSSLLPRRENVLREFSRILARCTARDSIVMALAGHGVQFKGSTDTFFCPMDGALDDRNTLIAISELYAALEQSPAGFKLLIVDACRNEVADSSRSRAVVDLESVTRPGEKMPPAGAAAIFSCSPGQKAYEDENLHHGLFFHSLIEGLRGGADFDKNRSVSLPELELFVKQQTPALAMKTFGKDQMPDVFNRTRGLVPLVKLERDRSGSLGVVTSRAWRPQLLAWNVDAESRVQIEGVYRGTEAERAGIAAGDVIERLNGQPVRDEEPWWELVESNLPGEKATLDVLREGEPVRLTVTIEPHRDEAERARRMKVEADEGASWAQYSYGLRLLDGRGVPQDAKQAAEWIRKAGDQGNRQAENQLGLMSMAGAGVTQDEREAVKWFRRAAEKGSAYSEYNIARAARNGRGIPKSLEEAARWYRLAAEHGHEDAQNEIGLALLAGRGVTRDEAEAARWFQRAAEQGDDQGSVNYANLLRTGRGVTKDEAAAAHWYEAAARNGNVSGQSGYGFALTSGIGVPKNEIEGLRWTRKAAEQGHSGALNSMGLSYATGRGVAKDETEAARWYRKGAEKGNADSQVNLGRALLEGRGVEKNEAEAVTWFRKAADRNHSGAMTHLGTAYMLGRGVEKNEADAVNWWRKVGARDRDAQYRLGLATLQGKGTKADRAEGIRLMRLAAKAGSTAAEEKLKELKETP